MYPYNDVNGMLFNKEFLDSVWNYLYKMAPLWNAGIAIPEPTDKMAYQILKQISIRKLDIDVDMT